MYLINEKYLSFLHDLHPSVLSIGREHALTSLNNEIKIINIKTYIFILRSLKRIIYVKNLYHKLRVAVS